MVPIAYRFSDGIGIGEATYSFNRGHLFQLTDGNILFAEQLAAGMRFRLEGRMTAEVTRAHGPRLVSRGEYLPDVYGNQPKPVRGTVKYSGHYPGMTVELGGMRIETTPGHLFYSVDRRGWCEVETFRIGERMRQENGRPRPVTRLGEIEYGYKELFGLEVEDFHTFFVGQGKLPGEAVWTHNGLANGGCAIPKPVIDEAIELGYVTITSRQRAGVVRPDRHHIFPQAERAWFVQRGVDIDRYTLQLDSGTHSALHYGGGPGLGGGFWNTEMMRRLVDREAALGRQLSTREILQEGARMRRAYANGFKVIHYTAP